MDAPRSHRRGKILACFRPAFIADNEPAVSCSSSLQTSGDEAARRNKRRLRRSLSAALKSLIYKSVLLKKSRSEYNREKGSGENHYEKGLDGLRSSILSRGKSFVKSIKTNVASKQCLKRDETLWSRNSNRSPLFSSNSSSPSSSSSVSSLQSSPTRSEIDAIQGAVSLDHVNLKRMKSMKSRMKKGCGRKCAYIIPTLEVCVLMVCLFALIWGKAFAVATCTSAWLFFGPSRRSPKLRRAATFEVVNSEDYKKGVIREGWLDIERTRVV